MLTDAEKDKIEIADRMLGRDKLEEKDIDWFLRKHTKREMFDRLRQERRDRNAAKKAGRAAVAVQEEERTKRSKMATELEALRNEIRREKLNNEQLHEDRKKLWDTETKLREWQGRVKTLIREVDRQEGMIRMLRWALKAVARGIGEGLGDQTDTDAAVNATEYDVRETIRQSLAELP